MHTPGGSLPSAVQLVSSSSNASTSTAGAASVATSSDTSNDTVAAELRSCVWVTTPTVGEARCLTGEFINSRGNLYPTGVEATGSATSAVQEKVYDLDEDLLIPKDVRELGLPARLTWLERSGFVIGWKEGADILVLMDTNMRCESFPSHGASSVLNFNITWFVYSLLFVCLFVCLLFSFSLRFVAARSAGICRLHGRKALFSP
jgi:hypothetical protein